MTQLDRRALYDQAAVRYDRARPAYPKALFDDILSFAQLDENARILEVGCGSGQATLSLARRGWQIDCIELSARLAELARGKLARFPHVRIISGDYDEMPLPAAAYDLLVAATAFHWLDPATRFHKAHSALKPGGCIALFWHRPASSQLSRDCMATLQGAYREHAPALAAKWQTPPPPDQMPDEFSAPITESGCFQPAHVKRYAYNLSYSAAAYIDLLGTFSDHLALPPATRKNLLAEIKRLINEACGGCAIREQVTTLYLACRL
ncbi:MAG: methyltransferase domain-containing protein [Chloroflexi bacterium]|nr:methyltransferase domain-containing protein [Chloroflexota bacterium]MCY4246004.1 methyltransferase domain-containing protein [Chloroflexota bacterium]